MLGIITFYRTDKGFGFASTTAGESFFIHVSNCAVEPKLGQWVTFDAAPPKRLGEKPVALNVRPAEGMSPKVVVR
jgi:cold shock CspA family protein